MLKPSLIAVSQYACGKVECQVTITNHTDELKTPKHKRFKQQWERQDLKLNHYSYHHLCNRYLPT